METETQPVQTDPAEKKTDLHPFFADLPIRKACMHLPDKDAFYVSTLPGVLRRYPQITPDAYWNLTVAEHAELTANDV